MTDATIITQAKALARQTATDTTLDATYLAWLNRIQRLYARKENWPQLRVLNATLTTVASTAAYDLPATFDRLMGDFVYYNPTAITGGYQDGTAIPVLKSGDPRLDSVMSAWKMGGTGAPSVAVVSSKAATPGTLQMVFYPFPQTAAYTIVYNYYRTPTALLNAPTSIDVDALGETFIAALTAQMEAYANQLDRAAYFRQTERDEYKSVLRALTTS